MNDLNSYLNKELLNLPFNLFSIFSNYININKDVKIAIVGGYIRDLLIKEIYNKPLFQPIDIDIVIEGSAICLAKFIKKNIKDVEICLIKEFEIYNTVEVNINNIKLDIASARKEIYGAPGFNPSVSDTNIKIDLKRRDFSINAIAFEVSTKTIYDFHQGIEHIYKKELHLLHQKSIRDDPSRILRCAKYASRLGFQISKESLSQSKKEIEAWPWETNKIDYGIKFPPGISIRLRMELSEIDKTDNLTKVISELNSWGLIALINKNIDFNNKFKRGLKWLEKLDGKIILYLIKDSDSLEKEIQRFYINSKEQDIINDYLMIKKDLKINHKKFLSFSPSKWTEYIELNNLNKETIKLLISDGGKFWKNFFRWLYKYRFIKSKKNGTQLQKEGWISGEKLGDEIKRLRYIEIDKNFNM